MPKGNAKVTIHHREITEKEREKESIQRKILAVCVGVFLYVLQTQNHKCKSVYVYIPLHTITESQNIPIVAVSVYRCFSAV